MKCDKCKKEMDQREDAVRVSAIAWNEPMTLLFAGARHIRCSPSRAQHIVHPDFEPVVDDRPEFDKRLWDDPESDVYEKRGADFREECERRYTDAWVQLQDECDEEEIKEKAFKRSRNYLEVMAKIKKMREGKRKKMTIKEAVLEVMKEKGDPMTIREIYDQITLGELYNFKAKEPKKIVRSTVRIQCEGVDLPISRSVRVFKLLEDGRYEPASK